MLRLLIDQDLDHVIHEKTWSSISAAEKLREVLEQAKQKEKPVDEVSKNETDAVAIVA
jgi:PHD/YefM family antitoxin component YafN of YafNO toxin-antitoxin module